MIAHPPSRTLEKLPCGTFSDSVRCGAKSSVPAGYVPMVA